MSSNDEPAPYPAGQEIALKLRPGYNRKTGKIDPPAPPPVDPPPAPAAAQGPAPEAAP